MEVLESGPSQRRHRLSRAVVLPLPAGPHDMFDVLHFEGLLARYTLRRFGAQVGSASVPTERIRHHDEHEALTMLRSAVDSETLRRLSAFVHAADLSPASPTQEPLELLWLVARKLVSGELVLERERIVPIASNVVERAVVVAAPPFENDISEASGLLGASLRQAEQTSLAGQAKQAEAMREAASKGHAFCEVCAGAHEKRVPNSEQPQDLLATQAKQAETLRAASKTGAAFCEKCANCQAPLVLPKPLPGEPPLPEPPRTELGSQAKQADALVSASASGKAFCEHCRC
jgi:hypothetical protein